MDFFKADLQRGSEDAVSLYRSDSLNDHLLSQRPFVEILTLLQEALQVRIFSTVIFWTIYYLLFRACDVICFREMFCTNPNRIL